VHNQFWKPPDIYDIYNGDVTWKCESEGTEGEIKAGQKKRDFDVSKEGISYTFFQGEDLIGELHHGGDRIFPRHMNKLGKKPRKPPRFKSEHFDRQQQAYERELDSKTYVSHPITAYPTKYD
jgi:hypothetical protein